MFKPQTINIKQEQNADVLHDGNVRLIADNNECDDVQPASKRLKTELVDAESNTIHTGNF